MGLALLLVASILAGTPAPGTLPSPRRADAAASGLPPVADRPTAIVAGRDGALWFTEAGAGRIGRITVAGAVREFTIPTPRSGPAGIVAWPDGTIWFTEEYADALGHLDPATGQITEYPVPDIFGQPGALVVGDGALYFAQNDRGSIGRFTPSTGRFAQFGISTGLVYGLVRGPDGAIWFAEGKVGPPTIGRLGRDGSIAIYSDAADFGNANIAAIASGPDGALWFAPTGSGALGRLTTAGTFSKVRIPGGAALALTPGPDRALWFASSGDGIGRLPIGGGKATLLPSSGHVFRVPVAGLVAGPDGNMWYTLPYIDSLARISPSGDEARFVLPSGPPRAFDLEVAADGSAWATLPQQNRVAHVTAAGATGIFRPLTHDSEPASIAPASDGSAWFSEYRAHRLARIGPDGRMREYPLPPLSGYPLGVAVAPDGMVWWTQDRIPVLSRLDPASGRTTDYPADVGIITAGIVATRDGGIWLSNVVTGAIERFDPADGRWSSFPVPQPAAHPYAIAAAPGGGVIFLLDGARQIGRVTTAGRVTIQSVASDTPIGGAAVTRDTTYFTDANPNHIGHLIAGGAVTYLQVPTANSDPDDIVAAPDGGVWFIEFSVGRLARIAPTSGAIREYALVATE